MTDHDVMARIGRMWGVRAHRIALRQAHHQPSWAATIKGRSAVAWIGAMHPYLGERRTRQLTTALATFAPVQGKIPFSDAQKLRARHAGGERICDLATEFGLEYEYARGVVRGLVCTREPDVPPILTLPYAHFDDLPEDLQWNWLAGYLEGEAFFRAGNDPRVSVESTDRDMVQRAATLMGATSITARSPRKEHWSTTYRAGVYGPTATLLMNRLAPFMGRRRRRQMASDIDA